MASVQEHGVVRLKLMDTSERVFAGQADFHTSVISGGALAAPTGATLDAIPRSGFLNAVGSRIIIEFASDAADVIESEESDLELPLLLVNRQGKVVGRDTVKLERMTGFKPSGTVDITCTANVFQRVAYIDAPTGLGWMIDPQGKFRAYFGDDTA
jgi:hypothetical protein